VGASAGGLEALEQFLQHVPPETTAAFVVVQHLDPDHKGMLVELLQRATRLPVEEVRDHVTIASGRVYVIPPNADVGILRGRLLLTPPNAPRGLRLPIDYFLRSLAEDQGALAVGVILSGMGSDGTAGLRAIKEKGGLGLVQDPATAKFDGMPRSAILAGVADVVAPADELAERALAYLRRAPQLSVPSVIIDARSQTGLEKIVLLLRARTGHDFSLYKKSTLYRRVERRIGIHQLEGIAQYVRYLQENPAEVDLLFKELLIGVTQFFRDPEVWDRLTKEVVPELLAGQARGVTVRAWVAGCSTGEEAYSLAMVFHEALAKLGPRESHPVQIFATDLDHDAIERARQAVYPVTIAADVSPERLARFFVRDPGGYRVGKAIRESVIFAEHDVIRDPPFTKLDLVSCRNVLIYLEPELQKKLLPVFHYSLKPGGLLVLGSAESIGPYGDRFESLGGKARVFRRREGDSQVQPVAFPYTFAQPLPAGTDTAPTPRAQPSLEALTDKWVLQHFAPAAVLATEDGDILYASARTGKYLEPAVGKATLNLYAMAREGLRQELGGALQRVRRTREPVVVRGLVVGTNGGRQTVDLTVQPLDDPPALKGKVLIVFTDAPVVPDSPRPGKAGKRGARPSPPQSPRVAELSADLQRSREELQTTREEMQSSQEELKSANEELQSTNEELQSTNEELTTSREEMQSLNEELQTVNAELSSKVEQLSRSTADLKNLLNSTEIATLFLDGKLNVRRYTDRATTLFKLIPGDVGRPLTDLTSQVVYPDLAADAREVLRTLVFKEKQARTLDGRWCLVRVMPYRTLDDRIEGVVMTFTDITAAKQLEAELRSATGKGGGEQ